VVAPFWLGRPPEESLFLAETAEGLGYHEYWIGEMLHFDAFALAGAVARSTRSITVTIGPLALGLRDPVSLAMGVGSIEIVGDRPARLAIGASSPTVVNRWHGRTHGGEAKMVPEAIGLIRLVLSGERTNHYGPHFRSEGFRSGLGRRSAHITVAAAGSKMMAAASAGLADRAVANLVTTEAVARIRQRSSLPVAVWVVAAVDPSAAAIDQIRRQLVLYLSAPGYRRTLAEAGMSELVARASAGGRPQELAPMITSEMIAAVAAVGSEREVIAAVEAYEAVGAEVMLVPVTEGDEGGRRTLRALA
jgi:probable F420-dependent oxidoreductase